MTDSSRIAVLGAGSWGTALAVHLAGAGHGVALWGHRAERLERIALERENRRYLPGTRFPASLCVEPDLKKAVARSQYVVVAVPSHGFAGVLDAVAGPLRPGCIVSWATKGLERGSGRFLSELLAERLGDSYPAAVISGPSFAVEVAAGMPTALTVASPRQNVAESVANLLHHAALRAYTTDDVLGVQLGGAAKNVMAIAAGISDGLGFGANARAAIITRGLAEMMRVGLLAGGRSETLTGLAGLGDLVLTCTDDKSRNRRFGLALGRGVDQDTARERIGQVVEGAEAARELQRLGEVHGCELPITEQVNAVLFDNRTPRAAVEALLARERRAEHE